MDCLGGSERTSWIRFARHSSTLGPSAAVSKPVLHRLGSCVSFAPRFAAGLLGGGCRHGGRAVHGGTSPHAVRLPHHPCGGPQVTAGARAVAAPRAWRRLPRPAAVAAADTAANAATAVAAANAAPRRGSASAGFRTGACATCRAAPQQPPPSSSPFLTPPNTHRMLRCARGAAEASFAPSRAGKGAGARPPGTLRQKGRVPRAAAPGRPVARPPTRTRRQRAGAIHCRASGPRTRAAAGRAGSNRTECAGDQRGGGSGRGGRFESADSRRADLNDLQVVTCVGGSRTGLHGGVRRSECEGWVGGRGVMT